MKLQYDNSYNNKNVKIKKFFEITIALIATGIIICYASCILKNIIMASKTIKGITGDEYGYLYAGDIQNGNYLADKNSASNLIYSGPEKVMLKK